MNRFDLAKRLAIEAGELIKKMNPHLGIVGKEGKHNFLTAADLASQKLITESISDNFADDKILAEETEIHITNPMLIDKLWIIDPIDGTTNYARAKNSSMVLIGYVENGVTLFGVAFNPFTNEMFFAEKNKGAFLNGIEIKIPSDHKLQDAYISTTLAYYPEIIKRNFLRGLKIDPMPWIEVGGCSSVGICETAAGKFDLYYHERSKPWDVAAVFLIAREAGAVIKNIKGENIDFTWSDFYVLGNEKLVEEFLKIQNKK